jgi:hypothetical protein
MLKNVAGARRTFGINDQKIQAQHLQRRSAIVHQKALTENDGKLYQTFAFGLAAISLSF